MHQKPAPLMLGERGGGLTNFYTHFHDYLQFAEICFDDGDEILAFHLAFTKKSDVSATRSE
jgi:hypothetical protein